MENIQTLAANVPNTDKAIANASTVVGKLEAQLQCPNISAKLILDSTAASLALKQLATTANGAEAETLKQASDSIDNALVDIFHALKGRMEHAASEMSEPRVAQLSVLSILECVRSCYMVRLVFFAFESKLLKR